MLGMLMRLMRLMRTSWKLKHRRTLAFAQSRHQNDAPIGELQGVMMGVVAVEVNLPETSHLLRDLANAETGQKPSKSIVNLDIPLERQFGAGAQADCDLRLRHIAEASRD